MVKDSNTFTYLYFIYFQNEFVYANSYYTVVMLIMVIVFGCVVLPRFSSIKKVQFFTEKDKMLYTHMHALHCLLLIILFSHIYVYMKVVFAVFMWLSMFWKLGFDMEFRVCKLLWFRRV